MYLKPKMTSLPHISQIDKMFYLLVLLPLFWPHTVFATDSYLTFIYLFMLVMTTSSYPNDSGHKAANSPARTCVYSHTATSAGSN